MIPWVALLKHAPAIAVAADALLARARSGPAPGPGDAGPDANVGARLARLEQGSRESAQLLKEIATQLNVLTLAQARTAQRVQVALGLSATATLLSLLALVLWFVAR